MTPAPALYWHHDWTVRHGDLERTPPLPVVDKRGDEVDLEQWTLRAQVRDRGGDLVHTFAVGTGIVLGRAELTYPDHAVTTSTVRLVLRPVDWAAIPRLVVAYYDLEARIDDEVVTTIMGGELHVLADTTHG